MTTPQYLGGYGESYTALGASAGAVSASLTITEAEVLADVPDAKYVLLVAAYRILEPVANLATLTGPSGPRLLASHQVDNGASPNQSTLHVSMWGALVDGLNATATWDYYNSNDTGRFKFLAFAYDRSAPANITAPDLGGEDTTPYVTSSTTLGAPSRIATVCQFTAWFEGFTAASPAFDTANGFTERDSSPTGLPTFFADQQDVTGAVDYATISQVSTASTNRWITVGCALGTSGGIYVDGAVHLN